MVPGSLLQRSCHAVIFWQSMPQRFLAGKAGLKGTRVSKAFGRFSTSWHAEVNATRELGSSARLSEDH